MRSAECGIKEGDWDKIGAVEFRGQYIYLIIDRAEDREKRQNISTLIRVISARDVNRKERKFYGEKE
jgi:uncharacterized DUF497 family protein